MKRGNGDGSIYQDGDRWRVVLTVANPKYGREKGAKRTKRVAWICHSKQEAKTKLREQLTKRDAGQLTVGDRQTVETYLRRWLEDTARLRLRDTSYQAYTSHVNRLCVHLGARRLTALAPLDVQEAYGEMSHLAPRTVRVIHQVLHQALEDAVRLRLIPFNPASDSTLPRVGACELQVFTERDIHRFLRATEDTDLSPLWLLFITTGLRHAEALGARWSDLAGNQLSVRVQLREPKGGGFVLAEVKSPSSRRTLSVPAAVVQALESHRLRQGTWKLAAGPAWLNRQNLIFTRRDGAPWRQDHIREAFHAVTAAAELPRIRVHDLRHTAATHMLRQGTDVRTVQSRLGHSKSSVTLDVYGHVLPSMDEEAAARMDRFLEGAS